MQFEESQEDREFRSRARDWLSDHVPNEDRPPSGPDMRAFDHKWQRTLFEGGWAGVAWPKEHGGLDLSIAHQLIWFEEYALAGAPTAGTNWIALNHAGPTLIAKGIVEQQKRHVAAILCGDETWCQGFSEPGAGSDLAGLATRAVIDGDDLVINGRKIWTSYANYADYQELLVRTDPAAPKHKGLSWIICDMRSEGIDIRPLYSMSGRQNFCEVTYEDVRVPLTNVVGGLNDGWAVAMTTLGIERGTAFVTEQMLLTSTVEALIDVARKNGRDRDGEIAQRLAVVRSEAMALKSMTYMNVSRIARTGAVGFESSMTRLFFGELTKRVAKLTYDVFDVDGLEALEDGGIGPNSYYDAFRFSIAAGTSEIQRNIIGERILGLPRTGKSA